MSAQLGGKGFTGITIVMRNMEPSIPQVPPKSLAAFGTLFRWKSHHLENDREMISDTIKILYLNISLLVSIFYPHDNQDDVFWGLFRETYIA